MAVNNITDGIVSFLPQELIGSAGLLINILQALGISIIIYVIFFIINTIFNRKKEKELEKINQNLEEIKNLLKRR